MKNNKFAFTLIELILIISIISILSVIGITSYDKSRNKALSREALANLKLIAAAERIYKMEDNAGSYKACSCSSTSGCNATTTGCNPLLKLNLNPTNWRYSVAANGDITVTGVAISGCNYTLASANFVSEAYTKTSSCP